MWQKHIWALSQSTDKMSMLLWRLKWCLYCGYCRLKCLHCRFNWMDKYNVWLPSTSDKKVFLNFYFFWIEFPLVGPLCFSFVGFFSFISFLIRPLHCHWGFGSHIAQQPCLVLSLEVHGGIRCVPVMVQHCLNSSGSKTTAAVPRGVSICRHEKRWALR